MFAMKTLKIRIKDKHSKLLTKLAMEVNYVFNYSNELSYEHLRRTGKFFSAYDLHEYTKGASKELSIHSQTIQAINEELVLRKRQFKKAKLRWRVSKGSRKSLGWIPFKSSAIKYINGQIKYGNTYFSLWDSYGINNYIIRSGCFVEDSRGRWYICLNVLPKQPIEIPDNSNKSEVGIDLGLKDFIATSDGLKIEAKQFYRKSENKLKIAQRANKIDRVRALHTKIKNQRLDFLHKLSSKLVKEHSAIYIGNVNAKSLSKTTLAKSVHDAAWSTFRTMLRYKCENAKVLFKIVNEKYSTQVCSCCSCIGDSSPKGRAGLGIREWSCVYCGTVHDRDINAANNILATGHCRPIVGIPF